MSEQKQQQEPNENMQNELQEHFQHLEIYQIYFRYEKPIKSKPWLKGCTQGIFLNIHSQKYDLCFQGYNENAQTIGTKSNNINLLRLPFYFASAHVWNLHII